MIRSALATLVLAVAPSHAVQIRSVAAERAPEVSVILRVTAADGSTVAGLGTADFSLFEDGRPVEGLAVRQSHPEEQPLAASLLIDTSGSMTKDDGLRRAIEGTKAFLGTLTPEDTREILVFGKEIEHVVRFGEPLDVARLDQLRPSGDTPMRDALVRALDDLTGQTASTKAIVVLTDGKDEGSTTTQDALRSKAQAARIPIHGIALAGGDPAPLQDLASATGGSVRTIAEPSDLTGVYTEIAAGIRTEYRLSYRTTQSNGRHRITVVARTKGGESSDDRDFVIATGPAEAISEPASSWSPLVVGVVVLGLLLAVGAVVLLLRRSPAVASSAEAMPEATTPGAPHPGRAHLQLVGVGASFPLVGSGIVVGRDPRAHIVIDDPSVSRTHVRLDVQGQEVWVEDLGSANGTLVNGVRVSRSLLRPGDVLNIGDQSLELRGAAT